MLPPLGRKVIFHESDELNNITFIDIVLETDEHYKERLQALPDVVTVSDPLTGEVLWDLQKHGPIEYE